MGHNGWHKISAGLKAISCPALIKFEKGSIVQISKTSALILCSVSISYLIMKQLELLEQELKMVQENITRLKKYQNENKEYKPYHCHVFGELKHRLVALKQRIVLINKESTYNLFN